jgi:hypothetical protein
VARQTEEHACCFKPNSASLGAVLALTAGKPLELRGGISPLTPFLSSTLKRGDMGNTMRTYAIAAFKTLPGMDAGNRQPGTCGDSIEEFTRYRGPQACRRVPHPQPRRCGS